MPPENELKEERIRRQLKRYHLLQGPGQGGFSEGRGPKITPEEQEQAFGYYLANQVMSCHFSLLSPDPQDQRHKECNVHCSLGISLLGPIHHVVKKSKQDEGSHMWRETKPWLSSQMTASTYLAAMWKSSHACGSSCSQFTHPSWHSLVQIADWWEK